MFYAQYIKSQKPYTNPKLDHSNWVFTTAFELQCMLSITPIDPAKETQKAPDKHILKLCQTAYDFAVLIRRSRDDIKIEMPKSGIAVLDTEHNIVSQEGPQSSVHAGVVICPISGALISYLATTNSRTVLQKPDVSVSPRTDDC